MTRTGDGSFTVIFLGAGASAAEGAPTQGQVFREYFRLAERGALETDRELATFLHLMFGVDVDAPFSHTTSFPTFEEVLGIIDLAELRREGLKDFTLENVAVNSDRIRHLRQHLVLAMSATIAHSLEGTARLHRRLLRGLRESGQLRHTALVTTNYDILIDNAVEDAFAQGPRMEDGSVIDYGARLYFEDGRPLKPAATAVPVLKLHGSLNWLFCPVCATVVLTVGEKGVMRLVHAVERATCRRCETLMVPLIVPPTYYKDLSNLALAMTWGKAETVLRKTSHVVFSGYSLPDADMHVKYLLKRAETNRHGLGPLHITVVNDHPAKTDQERQDEATRYVRISVYSDTQFG